MAEVDLNIATYENMREYGRQACNTGTVTPFPGFSPQLSRRASVIARFDRAGTTAIEDVFNAVDLDDAIQSSRAGTRFAIHTVILEADASSPEQSRPFITAYADGMTRVMNDRFVGRVKIAFDQLLVDPKGSVLLATRSIPTEILRTREELLLLYRGNGMNPIPTTTLQVTGLLLTAFPRETVHRQEALQRLHSSVEVLNGGLETRPLILGIDAVELVEAHAFLVGRT